MTHPLKERNKEEKLNKYSPLVSIDTYKALVDRCAKERLDYPIANGSAFHARILIAKLFEIAKKEVLLVTGHLRVQCQNGIDVYGYRDVIARAKNFLSDPSAKLKIVVQSGEVDGGDNNRFLKEIINNECRNGIVKLGIPTANALDSDFPHFMVADGAAYRIETGSDAHLDHENITAIANFGDAPTAVNLRDFYTEVTSFLDEVAQIETREFEPGAAI